jgi:hypothetical protein
MRIYPWTAALLATGVSARFASHDLAKGDLVANSNSTLVPHKYIVEVKNVCYPQITFRALPFND